MLLFYTGNAQDTTLCYFDDGLSLTAKSSARYAGKMVKWGDGWEAFAFYTDQAILMHGFFKDKRLETKQGPYKLYFPGGKLRVSTTFNNGAIDGIFTSWYENGQLSDSGLMNQNVKTGLWRTYYTTGNVEAEGKYDRGLPDSLWHWYHTNGKQATIELYKSTKLADLTCFDTSGNKTGSNCRIDKKPCPERSYNFDQYVINNLLYPKQAMRKRIEGTVAFEFFVTKEGKLTRINFTNISDELLQQEVIRLLKAVPKWEPAVSHNREIDYLYTYEVPFYLGRDIEGFEE
jgi:TonB family protein